MDQSSDKPSAAQTPSEGTLVRAGGAMPAPRTGYGAGYPGQAEFDTAQTGINLLQYWRMVIKHRFAIASIIAAFLVLGTLRFMLLTPVYSSALRLQIDRNSSKIVERGSLNANEGLDNEFLKTQYELLQTRSMAERFDTEAWG